MAKYDWVMNLDRLYLVGMPFMSGVVVYQDNYGKFVAYIVDQDNDGSPRVHYEKKFDEEWIAKKALTRALIDTLRKEPDFATAWYGEHFVQSLPQASTIRT